jgi:HD-like signal output (HDOD) protein
MEVQLVSFPEIYFRISEALQSPKSSITHVANLISKDTALSAALLKLANSAMYGVPAKVESIPRAAALIGGNALSTLALGVSVITSFGAVPAKWVNMQSFWKHSIAVAVLGQVLSVRKTPRAIERIFVGGMLHDIGRLVLLRHAPLAMTKVLAAAEAEKAPLVEMELRMLGFDHAELGGRLLEKWGFPRILSDLVRYHHLPEKKEDSFSLGVLAVADVLAGVLFPGSGGSMYLPGLSDTLWEMMELSPEALDMAIRQTRRQITEIYDLFKGGADGGTEFSFR